jgi:hypothetical protein
MEKCHAPMKSDLEFSVEGDEPKISLISPDKCNDIDRFYCEQAIWEGLGMFSVLPGVPNNFKYQFLKGCFIEAPVPRDCERLYLKSHPEQTGKVVVMHFIPPSTYFLFPYAIDLDELHSIENLRAIKIENLHDERLQKLRKEWMDYIRQCPLHDIHRPSRQEVLDKADSLFTRYKSLFVNNSVR